MARLEHIRHESLIAVVECGKVIYEASKAGKVIEVLPQIFLRDGSPWQEANLWAMERATEADLSIKTIEANMVALHGYAKWLEQEKVSWLDFPSRRRDRCLVRYRGHLIGIRDGHIEEQSLAPSTTSERMRSVIQFYRWVLEMNLFVSNSQLWKDIPATIQYIDKVGFERTLTRISTDISIPNRRRPGDALEDGLLPVSLSDRDQILEFVQTHHTQELFLMLSLGFFTGMRIGTVSDLKIQTLEQAIPDPCSPDLFMLSVGPGAYPKVHTKFGVSGHIWVTRELLDELKKYACSVRRLKREAKAEPKNKDILFLTKTGSPYANRGPNKSSAIHVVMFNLREFGIRNEIGALRNFHFHQARCTFATEFTRIGLSVASPINVIELVRNALLHKSEETTLKYIKFVQKEPIKQEAANAFTQAFSGLIRNKVEVQSHA